MSSPLYPVNSAVQGISQGLYPDHVAADFFKEWVQLFPLYNFVGNEKSRPIVRHQMKVGEGWQYTVGRLNALDFTQPIRNFDQVSGAGQKSKVDECSIICEKISLPYTLQGKDLIDLGTPIQLSDSIRPQLIEASKQCLNKDILDSAMFDYANPLSTAGGYIPSTQLPSYDRVVLAGTTPGGLGAEGDADRAAYYAKGNLKTAWNDLLGPTYELSGLSAAHLFRLKEVADLGGYQGGSTMVRGLIEHPIQPAYMKTHMGFPINDYIYLCTSKSIAQLSKDPMFFNSTLARGTVISPNQPQLITGANYHGVFHGIHIYEVRDLSRYISKSADGEIDVAWELFIGAGAWSLGWFKEPTIAFRENLIDTIQEFTTHEIRGHRALKFASKQPTAIAAGVLTVEQGIIHSFVSV